jgi:diadenosine tetraphosphatase ApaH/serine/threonine PP2A family protein phosphatase
VGHSHIQSVFRLNQQNDRITLEAPKPDVPLDLTPRLILNPGSVGQPRDRDPRAAYAFYDTEHKTWTPRRAQYNVSEVQARIRESGLPEKHAVRLGEGW